VIILVDSMAQDWVLCSQLPNRCEFPFTTCISEKPVPLRVLSARADWVAHDLGPAAHGGFAMATRNTTGRVPSFMRAARVHIPTRQSFYAQQQRRADFVRQLDELKGVACGR